MNDQLVKSPSSSVVHLGRRSRFVGTVVTACNGRSMTGYVLPVGEVTCKRCIKLTAKAPA